MEDCLYAIMLMSANEVCNGVAEHIGGSIKGFVKMMNKRAKELGAPPFAIPFSSETGEGKAELLERIGQIFLDCEKIRKESSTE